LFAALLIAPLLLIDLDLDLDLVAEVARCRAADRSML